MVSRQKQAAEERVRVRNEAGNELAQLLGWTIDKIPYPHSNDALENMRKQIQDIKDELTNYEIIFQRKEHITIDEEIIDSRFMGFVSVNHPTRGDYHNLLLQNSDNITNIISQERSRLDSSLKVRIGMYTTLKRAKDYQEDLFSNNLNEVQNEEYEYRYGVSFKSNFFNVHPSSNLEEILFIAIALMDGKIDKYINESSGWIFVAVESIFIEVVKFTPPTGASYLPLPKNMPTRCNGVINIKNDDNKCFM